MKFMCGSKRTHEKDVGKRHRAIHHLNMRPSVISFHRYLLGSRYTTQLVIFYSLCIFLKISLYPLHALLDRTGSPTDVSYVYDNSNLFTIVLAGPLIETFIFQHLIFTLVKKAKVVKKKFVAYLLSSSILFGLSHSYSVYYVIFAVIMGLALGYIYYFYRTDRSKAFWSTAFIHALLNATAALAYKYL